MDRTLTVSLDRKLLCSYLEWACQPRRRLGYRLLGASGAAQRGAVRAVTREAVRHMRLENGPPTLIAWGGQSGQVRHITLFTRIVAFWGIRN